MKKTISILVIVAMMLASILAIVPVSAADPEGTAVTNEAEFLAMTADGTYYLANDITLTKSYPEFKGTLDGNGKTITVNNTAVFVKLNGATVKNLKVVAKFTTLATSGSALANTATNTTCDNINLVLDMQATEYVATAFAGMFATANGNITITNSTAEGIMSVTAAGYYGLGTGAFVGRFADGGNTLTIKNCINKTYLSNKQPAMCIGGFVGYTNLANVVIENCINYGEIVCSAKSADMYNGTGGIIGEFDSLGDRALTIKNCVNYGNVSAVDTGEGMDNVLLGGIVGRTFDAEDVLIENCVNYGNITHVDKAGQASAAGIWGGILTYNKEWAPNTDGDLNVKYCANFGTIGGSHYDGGIVARAWNVTSADVVLNIENCANYGDINSVANYSAGIFCTSATESCISLNINNCYNAGRTEGKYAGGIICYYNAKSGTNGINKDAIKVATVTINNTINAGIAMYGETPMYAMINTFTCDGEVLKITNSGTTVEGQALSRDAEDIEVSGEAIAIAELLKVVPGDSRELAKLFDANKDNHPDDYTAGWSAFTAALELADLIINKASSAEDVKLATDTMKSALEGLVLNTNIDKTELEAALTASAAFDGKAEEYTDDTWAAFASALEAAKAAKDATKQSVVNAATAALNAAIDGLEKKPDLAALAAEIAKHENLAEAEYTTKTWADFASAMAVAKALKNDANATGAAVEVAIANLASTSAALVKKGDVTPLQAKIDEVVAQYKEEGYTATTYDKLRKAINNAKDAVTANDSTEAEIAELIANIDEKIAGLTQRATLEELNALLATIAELKERDYTEATWTVLAEAVEAANKATNPNTVMNLSAEKEAELVAAIKEALEGLIGWADYTEIDALIAELGALKAEDYTEASWKALQDAVKAVDALKSNRDSTEKDAEKALADIKAAKDGLKAAEVPTEKPTEQPAEPTEPAKQGGCGGFVATSVAVIAVVSVLGSAVVLKKKKD